MVGNERNRHDIFDLARIPENNRFWVRAEEGVPFELWDMFASTPGSGTASS